jgi:hypothetical protein
MFCNGDFIQISNKRCRQEQLFNLRVQEATSSSDAYRNSGNTGNKDKRDSNRVADCNNKGDCSNTDSDMDSDSDTDTIGFQRLPRL